MDPLKYDGKSDVQDYLLQFEIIAGVNRWHRDEKGQRLAGCLIEEAREVLGTLGAIKASRYKSLVKALLERYSPEGREGKYSVELMNRKGGKKEGVSQFANDLRKLARKAYPGTPLDERVLVGLFARGLPSRDMRPQVHVGRPKNLDEAVLIAQTYEIADDFSDHERSHKPKPTSAPIASVKGKGRGRKRRSRGGMTPPPEEGEEVIAAAEISAENPMAQALRTLTDKIDRMEESRNAKLRANVPATAPGQVPSQGQGAPGPRRPLSEIRCYGCQQMGHYRSHCPYAGQATGPPAGGAWPQAPPAQPPPAARPSGGPAPGAWPPANRAQVRPQATGWPAGAQGQAPLAPVDQAPLEEYWGAPGQPPLN
jgi:hypothetical protein